MIWEVSLYFYCLYGLTSCDMKISHFKQLKRCTGFILGGVRILSFGVRIWLPFHPAAFAVHLQCARCTEQSECGIKMLITETGWPCSQRLSPLLQWSAWPIRIRCLPISQVILPTDSKAPPLAPFLIIWYLCSFKMSHSDLPLSRKFSWPFPCHRHQWGPHPCVCTAHS